MRAAGISNVGILGIIFSLFAYPWSLAVFLFRASSACAHKGRVGRKLARVLWRLNIFLCGCDIEVNAEIGPGFVLPHPVGVVIGNCKVGKNAAVFQHATLGAIRPRNIEFRNTKEFRPIIGDNVTVYAGASVVGHINVGDNVTIGTNAVVIKDVPANSVAVGVPARVILNKTTSLS